MVKTFKIKFELKSKIFKNAFQYHLNETGTVKIE